MTKQIQKNDDSKNYIYIESNQKLYKFKIDFNHMDVVDAIENYISMINTYEFEIVSEEEVRAYALPKKFFPYVGKFKLDNNLKSTKNYFVPQKSVLLQLLAIMYWEKEFTSQHFNSLYTCYKESLEKKDDKFTDLVLKLCSKIQVELKAKYQLRDLNDIMKNLNKYASKSELEKSQNKLKLLFQISIQNKKRIVELKLMDNFDQALTLESNKKIKK